ncbi:MAG: hypothetical protein ABI461_08065, partial [Polyangiaceae bacterium]
WRVPGSEELWAKRKLDDLRAEDASDAQKRLHVATDLRVEQHVTAAELEALQREIDEARELADEAAPDVAAKKFV